MSRWTPTKRRDLIRKLRALGFEGPSAGTRHQYMVGERKRLPIPTYDEISVELTRRVVHEVEAIIGREISLEEWERL